MVLFDELQAHIRVKAHCQMLRRYYQKKIKNESSRIFRDDLVLCRVMDNKKELNSSKLGTTWKGCYIIDKVVGDGA